MRLFSKLCYFVLSGVFLISCATIVGSPIQVIPISSVPDGASVVITDERGMQVFDGKTPTSVTLKKSDGSYWGKKTYNVSVSKEGFGTKSIPITASANGWYIAGNILLGGLIGWFIVDPLYGDMYTLSPDLLAADLSPQKTGDVLKPGELRVVLIQDVPSELRSKMIKVN